MELITTEIRQKLLANWRDLEANEGKNHDPYPVVKFFNPIGHAKWLITQMVEHNQDILFGLCDLGMECPELGYVSLKELESIKILGGVFTIERDLYFTAKYPLSVYTQAARANRAITLNPRELIRAQAVLKLKQLKKKRLH